MNVANRPLHFITLPVLYETIVLDGFGSFGLDARKGVMLNRKNWRLKR